jgi:hypothetical protein
MYVSKIYVCVEKKKENRNFFLLFFYRDRMSTLGEKWIVRENEKKYLSRESKSCNETTTTDDRSIGNSVSSTFFIDIILLWKYVSELSFHIIYLSNLYFKNLIITKT